ncbi:AAA family ATPase [Tunturiibacter gelidiferens]|uniref:AAA family ATPase n=1 Tax=Tunturiibacter gelidiferens TaxID=3069689 RepID=UPI003D9B093C
MNDWHLIPHTPVKWLVDGLLPADGYSALCGKPKAGKSTAIRNLIASVVKSRPFLGRPVNVPESGGRVLYVHLDRKDKPARVVAELKTLGITSPDEVSRLHLMVAEDLPSGSFQDRLDWLKSRITDAKPHLIVIDLLWQFVCATNANDYKATLDGINALQDALNQVAYEGALVVAIHGRKATNPDQPFDDVLGSTGQRGSFSTLLMLTQYRREQKYTIMSDQTEREAPWGELDETVIERNADGTLSLGQSFAELESGNKRAKRESDIQRLLKFLEVNPGSETEEIMVKLAMSKAHLLQLLATIDGLIYRTGRGVKGDPLKYFLRPLDDTHPPSVQAETLPTAQREAEEMINEYVTPN